MAKNIVKTPLMKQYFEIKAKYPDAILLFRVGDFYETFSDDAIRTSEILGITLTKRANGSASSVELAGFPYHALDTYLPKLIRAGQRVAICEQLEDPKLTKKIVKRGVTELITPGVTLNDNVLENKENNFIASVFFEKNIAGIAFLDVSTGEFLTTEGTFDYIVKLINNFKPKEIVFERSKKQVFEEKLKEFYLYPLEDWYFNYASAYEKLIKHFGTINLKGFGIDDLKEAVCASGALISYLDTTQHSDLKHIHSISKIPHKKYVLLDKFTSRNLEIFEPLYDGGKALIDIIDKTHSPMGGRKIRRWLSFPLSDTELINKRLDAVSYFVENETVAEVLAENIRQIYDIERLAAKISTRRITPRETVHLKNAISHIGEIKKKLSETPENQVVVTYAEKLDTLDVLKNYIGATIADEPASQIGKGQVIREGVSAELDDLREISGSGQNYLSQLRQRLSAQTQIPSLKIGFNKVFGYYIEVTNAHKNRVPPEWIRKQTLVNAERYITPELKEYEEKILSANEKILSIETAIYQQVIDELQKFIVQIKQNADLISDLDCFLSFAILAKQNNYVRPQVDNGTVIDIKDGRHPVIEQQLPVGEPYVPNDIFLDQKEQQILIITGPNMAGKSALLRQTALITILAQTGSFVPASKARIGYVDKIFTRVGASDNISLGESTFMVEMTEAANILNNLTDRSLIIFDELGRGTSTYDGISIAWAIVEYIHRLPAKRPKTLFATHYHELNEMEKIFDRIKNYNVSVKEAGKKIIFLRKLVRGGSEHSFGIHVAKMAGLPPSVVKRAEEILQDLEKQHSGKPVAKPSKKAEIPEGYQLSFFQLDDPVLKNIRDLILSTDINNLTPIEALNLLDKIKRQLK